MSAPNTFESVTADRVSRATGTTHITASGEVVDPATDKDLSHWSVERDAPPDVHLVFFSNPHIQYFSYDPPKGFTADEIVKFGGAEGVITVKEATKLISEREKKGTLELVGEEVGRYHSAAAA